MKRSEKHPRTFGPISGIKASAPLIFPKISPGGKILTRHFMNLHFVLHRDPLSMLCFLIYLSNHTNQITYSIKLLNQYRTAINFAQARWGAKKLARSIPTNRRSFKILIEKGLLIQSGEKTYIVNPILAYSKLYVKTTFWQQWVIGPKDQRSAREFINHAEANYQKRKAA